MKRRHRSSSQRSFYRSHSAPFRRQADHPLMSDFLWNFLNEVLGIEHLSGDPFKRRLQLYNQNAFLPLVLLCLGLGALAMGVFEAIRRPYLERIQAASRATRRKLRAARRKSTRQPPTPEALEEAWTKAHKSLEWRLRLGSMLADLEPVVDQSYIRDADGTIVGRKAGIRGWLRQNCPVLAQHYKTAMGYKAIANRFRLAIGLREPFTLEDVLDGFELQEGGDMRKEQKDTRGKKSANIMVSNAKKRGKEREENFKNSAVLEARDAVEGGVKRKKSVWAGSLKAECERTQKVLEALQKRNRSRGRPLRRSLSTLDVLLHSQLRLLNVPHCA